MQFTKKQIKLEPVTHTYEDTDGLYYTAVSAVIAKYKHPFDREGISAAIALKTNRTQKEVLSEWKDAANYGIAVHKQIEDYFSSAEGETGLIAPYLHLFDRWKDEPVTFYPEVILATDTVAGTSDMLIEREGQWTVLDWKTNKSIDKDGFNGKKMLGELSHLLDCNFVHYSLQLSMYALMLGKPIKRLNLIHLPRGKETITVIPCLDLRREAELVLRAQQ